MFETAETIDHQPGTDLVGRLLGCDLERLGAEETLDRIADLTGLANRVEARRLVALGITRTSTPVCRSRRFRVRPG